VRVIEAVYVPDVRSCGILAIFGGKHEGFLGTNTVLGVRFDSFEFDAGHGQAMNKRPLVPR